MTLRRPKPTLPTKFGVPINIGGPHADQQPVTSIDGGNEATTLTDERRLTSVAELLSRHAFVFGVVAVSTRYRKPSGLPST
jgi:hypothetical protein